MNVLNCEVYDRYSPGTPRLSGNHLEPRCWRERMMRLLFFSSYFSLILLIVSPAQVVKPPPLMITCSDPQGRVYTRQDSEIMLSCLWRAVNTFGYKPSSILSTEEGATKPPKCNWYKNDIWFSGTSLWSGTESIVVVTGSVITIKCATVFCSLPSCLHQTFTITVAQQDVKLFKISPSPPIYVYGLVQFGWCAKMKSTAWKYQFFSKKGEPGIVIPSNYHTEIEDEAYPQGLRSTCSSYYNYKVNVSYTDPGHYIASLTIQNGSLVELSVILEVEPVLLHVFSATSSQLHQTTNLRLTWILISLSSKVVAFQLTDINKVGAWNVTANSYAIKTDFCSPPLSAVGSGIARIHFLVNERIKEVLTGTFDLSKHIVGLTANKDLCNLRLNSNQTQRNTYYCSSTSGLNYSYKENETGAGSSDHNIIHQDQSLTYLFQVTYVASEMYSLNAHIYLHKDSALYRSLTDMDLEVHFFNSGDTLLFTLIYIVWFIPLQDPLLQCEWTFILELYGSRKRYPFENPTYTYKDNVPNAATFIPDSVLPIDVKRYAGFVAKVNCSKSGLKPVILKTFVGSYASKILNTSIYCLKLLCKIYVFKINKPTFPSSIITITKGSSLSVFVSIHINCPASQGIHIRWRIYSISNASELPVWDDYLNVPQVSVTNQSSIEIPRFALNYGFYLFNVSININTDDDDVEPFRCNSDSAVVDVQESALLSVIKGGSYRSVGFSFSWTLDGSSSSDPDSLDSHRGLSFTWYCTKNMADYNSMNLSKDAACHPNQTHFTWINPNAVIQTVKPEALQGSRNYYFRLVVSKRNRTGYTDQTVFVIPGLPPDINVVCIENCHKILIPTERFTLSGICLDCSKTSRPVYEWSLYQNTNEVDFNWTSNTATGRSIADMSINALTFINIADKWYTLVLKVTTWTGAQSMYKYTYFVNSPPKAGKCNINPSSGTTLQTKFIVSCSGFTDVNQPLSYKVLASVDKVSDISSLHENSLGAIIYYGYAPTTPPSLLPIGVSTKGYTLKIYVQVYDSLASYSQIELSATVKNFMEGASQEVVLNELISMINEHNSPMNVFLETADFLKSGHLIYMIASLLNNFIVKDSVYPLKDERTKLRESLLNITSSIPITNIMGINQIITSISELTRDTKELHLKSQQHAVGTLTQVGAALTKYRNEILGSEEKERLSSGILTSLSNVMDASLLNVNRFTTDIQAETVEVLKQTLSVMETVTDIVSHGKVPGETETSMKTELFNISLKKAKKWDIASSYLGKGHCRNCFYPTLKNYSSVVPNDAVVTTAFYEFKENPIPWLKNGREIDTAVTGFYMAAINDKGGMVNVIPEIVDMIMERRNETPVFKISLKPDEKLKKTTSGAFNFEINLESKAEWFVQFFYKKKITFAISLHIGIDVTNNPPIAFYNIPKVQMVQGKHNKEEYESRIWNPNIYRIPIELIPNTSPVLNLTIALRSSYEVWWKTTKLLSISIFNVACLDFKEVGENWNEANCNVGPLTNNKKVHCICKGFPKAQRRSTEFLQNRHTFVAARIIVMPNPIDLKKATFESLQSNPVTLITVIGIFTIYVSLALWAYKKDKSDLISKHQVIILPDNDPFETENYLVTIYTGSYWGSSTTADVYLTMMGTDTNSQVHHLKCPGRKIFLSGGLDTFLVSTKYQLGDIRYIRIWHNNRGDSPGWYLSRIKIENMFSEQVWYFMCRKWLNVDREDSSIHRIFYPMNTNEPLQRMDFFLINLSFKLYDHIWLSVFSSVLPSSFNRVQKLSCCLTMLMSSLLSNIVLFNTAKNQADVTAEMKIARLIMVGLESALVTIPVQFLVHSLFRSSQARTPSTKEHSTTENDLQNRVFCCRLETKSPNWREHLEIFYLKKNPSEEDISMEIKSIHSGLSSLPSSLLNFPKPHNSLRRIQNNCIMPVVLANEIHKADDEDTITPEIPLSSEGTSILHPRTTYSLEDVRFNTRDLKNRKLIPIRQRPVIVCSWWCVYTAWSLVFIISMISASVIILYGLSYGFDISVEWFLASVVSFLQSVCIIQTTNIVLSLTFASYFPKYYDDIPWTSRCHFLEIDLGQASKNADEKRALHFELISVRKSKEYQPLKYDEIARIKRENMIKSKAFILFKGTVSHFIFLILVLNLAYSTDNANVFHYNQAISKLFSLNLSNVDTVDRIYYWASDVFLPLIHNSKQPMFLTDSWSIILGLPRMRQVKATHCFHTNSSVYTLIFTRKYCIQKYGIGPEDELAKTTKQFDPNEYDGFTFEYFIPHWNYSLLGAEYGPGGYTVYFFPEKALEHSLDKLQDLENKQWLNEETWAVVVELATFNPDVQLFCAISVIFEVSRLGITNADLSVNSFTLVTFKQLHYMNIFLNFVFIAFMLIYIADEIYTICLQKKKYINIPNGINLFLKSLLLLAVLLQVVKFDLAVDLLNLYSLYPKQFMPFYTASHIDVIFRNTLGFITFFTVLKTLQYARFFYEVRLAQRSIMNSLPGIFSMSLVVAIFFSAYTAFGYLVFGQYEWSHNSLIHSAQTVLSYCVSEFKESTFSTSRIFGAIYVCSFMVVMIGIVINLFQAVIISAYEDAKQLVYEEPSDEVEVIAFLVYKMRMIWALLTRKAPVKTQDTFSSLLYGQPNEYQEQSLGLKTKKVNGKITPSYLRV
ncbi:polycystin family receptor for egg jelly [Ascaphus truei]|uniref:polycystin family receptor for egg jelly n=1 Tax=Ascaphus truei TaxID=8439 RepID=UPI003F5A2846